MPESLSLPPLPEGVTIEYGSPGFMEEGYPSPMFTAEQMQAYALAERVAERERCAKLAEAEIDAEWPSDDLSVQAESIAAAIRSQE